MIDRRQFLQQAGTALFAAAHVAGTQPAAGERRGPRAPTYEGPEDPRLLRLDLRTAASFADLKRFYLEMLEMSLLEETPQRLTIQGGRTVIAFHRAKPDEGDPTYHVAFNIPENKLFQAREWQRQRSPILKRAPDAYSHPDYDDVTDWWHWNSTAIFFEDPAGNLLEYIARHDLKNASAGPFTPKDILYASEIGFVAQDVPGFGEQLQTGTGLELYWAGGRYFRAFGDPNGLLLVLQEGRQRWHQQRSWAVYSTEATIRDGKGGGFAATGYPYRISV